MITIPNWMFLATFEELRETLIANQTIESFIHNGRGVWGSDFGSCSFVIRNQQIPEFKGTFKRLFEKQGSVASVDELEERFFREKSFVVCQSKFTKIPGSPIAFWVSDNFRDAFEKGVPLTQVADPRQGMATGNNARFVRLWFEVDWRDVGLNFPSKETAWDSKAKWFPYNKGGPFKKWYGNNDYVLRFDHPSYSILKTVGNHCPSERYYFKEGITWGLITVAAFSCRYIPQGFVFDVGGSSAFPEKEDLHLCLNLLNSNTSAAFLKCLNPTVNTQVGDLKKIPVLIHGDIIRTRIYEISNKLVKHAKDDWDRLETSWDFQIIPFLSQNLRSTTVEAAFTNLTEVSQKRIKEVKSLEEENNRIFIEAYGLQGDLSPEVQEGQITLTRPDREEDTKRLISYAIGCMMGRYSLDKTGLIYAHGENKGFDPNQYKTFPADQDGIIPIMEGEWFSHDTANRFVEFITVAWPRDHLEENLKFIAESLGPNGSDGPRETIRRYLAIGFFKDHLRTYKNRPIYWLFSSGKQRAFQCLVYLHRYNEGTMSRMRTEYGIPLQGKIASRIEQLSDEIQNATSTSHRKKMEKERDTLIKQQAELKSFDEKLRHYADLRISVDLDDGVKVNYGKFGDLLAEVKTVTGGNDE